MRGGPPRRGIGRCDELRRHFAGSAERRVVKGRQILLDHAASRLRRQARGALDAVAVAGVGLDQAGVDGKAFTANQALVDAAQAARLEQLPQQIAIAKAAVPVLREGRVDPAPRRQARADRDGVGGPTAPGTSLPFVCHGSSPSTEKLMDYFAGLDVSLSKPSASASSTLMATSLWRKRSRRSRRQSSLCWAGFGRPLKRVGLEAGPPVVLGCTASCAARGYPAICLECRHVKARAERHEEQNRSQ